VRTEALGQPPDRNLHEGIGPEKSRAQHSELDIGELQVFLDVMEGRRQGPAIHVVEEQNRREQQDDRTMGRSRRQRMPRRCNRDQVAAFSGFM
jgi:hypothetical protein